MPFYHTQGVKKVPNDNAKNASSEPTCFNFDALFSTAEPTPKDNESDEDSGNPSLEISEDGDVTTSDDGDQDAGTNEQSDVYRFGDADYTQEQITEALKHAGTFSRFNQSIAPLVDNIKQFHDHASRFQAMAVTETERQIDELQKALASGQLSAQDYQLAHQALQSAQTRKGMLEAAGEQVNQKRIQALNNARRHNAAQVATNLVKAGWSHEQMTQAQSVAKGAMTMDQFADIVSPAFMEILRDAFELRSQKAAAAAKLQQQGQRVVKVKKPTTSATPPRTKKPVETGSPEWINGLWGGK